MASEELPLGAWAGDRARIEVAQIGDRGDIADLPEDQRFRVHVARLINRREQNAAAEFDQPAAFVLVSPGAYEAEKAGRTEERLIHTGSRRLTGRIHLVTAAATSSVVDEFRGDDRAMFERLNAIGMAQTPTLIYVPQKPVSSLSYYPGGSATDDGLTDVPLKAPQVTEDAIRNVIDAVHKKEFVTPDQSGPSKIWANAAKGEPQKDAEKRVQQLLRVGLAASFIPYSIRQEQPEKVGRTDLEIVDDRTGSQGHSVHYAVLELKVLRSRGSTGVPVNEEATREHIKEGVEQAHAYGKDKNTRLQMLCCFDMRDSDDGDVKTFAHINANAITLKVLLHRWFLYRNSATYRAALAASARS